MTESGKKADILYTIQVDKKCIIFDLERSVMENIEYIYPIIEKIKNGTFTSTKYEPKLKRMIV